MRVLQTEISTQSTELLAPAPRWREIAKRTQDQRDATVATWAVKTLGTPTPRLPPPGRTNVRHWPVESGHLTAAQIEMTSTVPTLILHNLATGSWTAEDVFLAFSARAVIAHHLTNPLSDAFFEEGLARARHLDEHLIQTGTVVGPLHGLPISLKDSINLEGRATTLGFVALADNAQESSDAVIARLYAAGAVFFCKTNLFGRTSSPDNRLLSAGGSSGGEGSLVALRGSPLGIGTDSAGSVRTPANFNGIYGLCPTYGRFPLHTRTDAVGLINSVAGPLSSSVDGLELYARTVLSFEPWSWDPVCVPMPWDERAYRETRERAAAGRLSFGFVANDAVVRPHPPILRGMRETRRALIRAGHEVLDVDLLKPDDGLWDLALSIFCADGGAKMRKVLSVVPEPPVPETFVPQPDMALSAAQLEEKAKMLAGVRLAILSRWRETASRTRTGRPVDVLVMPSGGHVAPPHSTMEYWLYEAVSNIIDWPCATFPCGNVSITSDPPPGPDNAFDPMSPEDRKNWDKYTPEAYENGAICLQVIGPRFQEERVLASLRVMDEALGRGPNQMV